MLPWIIFCAVLIVGFVATYFIHKQKLLKDKHANTTSAGNWAKARQITKQIIRKVASPAVILMVSFGLYVADIASDVLLFKQLEVNGWGSETSRNDTEQNILVSDITTVILVVLCLPFAIKVKLLDATLHSADSGGYFFKNEEKQLNFFEKFISFCLHDPISMFRYYFLQWGTIRRLISNATYNRLQVTGDTPFVWTQLCCVWKRYKKLGIYNSIWVLVLIGRIVGMYYAIVSLQFQNRYRSRDFFYDPHYNPKQHYNYDPDADDGNRITIRTKYIITIYGIIALFFFSGSICMIAIELCSAINALLFFTKFKVQIVPAINQLDRLFRVSDAIEKIFESIPQCIILTILGRTVKTHILDGVNFGRIMVASQIVSLISVACLFLKIYWTCLEQGKSVFKVVRQLFQMHDEEHSNTNYVGTQQNNSVELSVANAQ